MKKHLFTLCLIFILLFSLSVPAAADSIEAEPKNAYVYVNDELTLLTSFNIEGYNYFKLRDIAYLLNSTSKQFDVTWNSETEEIGMISGMPYQDAIYGLQKEIQYTNKTTVLSNASVLFNGAPLSMQAYNIGGNNYFKLRDVLSALDVHVTWDDVKKSIIIDT